MEFGGRVLVSWRQEPVLTYQSNRYGGVHTVWKVTGFEIAKEVITETKYNRSLEYQVVNL
jgi:hypothetical protein